MKNLPNYISLIRIILSLTLFFTTPLSLGFCIIYAICAISDVLDGYLARNFGSTDIGPKLDSIADFVFFISFIIVIWPVLNMSLFIILWILLIVLIKIICLLLAYKKFNKFLSIHSYLNKFVGFLLVLLPLWILLFSSTNSVLMVLSFVATVSAIEELVIIIYSKEYNPDLKSILFLL